MRKSLLKRLKNRAGMTMMETMVAVGTALALGSLAIPAVVRSVHHYRVNATSRTLVSTLQAARFMAVMRQGVYGVQINLSTHSIEVVGWNALANSWQSLAAKDLSTSTGYDALSNRRTITSNVTLSTSGLGASNVIAFNPKGELMNTSGTVPSRYVSGATLPTITISVGSRTRNVVVTRFGNLQVFNKDYNNSTQM